MPTNKNAKISFKVFLLLGLLNSGVSYAQENMETSLEVPDVCNSGQLQSPIDLSMENVTPKEYKENILKFTNYDEQIDKLIVLKEGNNEAVLKGSWEGVKPTISIFSNETYVFHEAHIHWSSDDNNGTEHSIEEQKYAAELHLVHVNQKYENFDDSLNYPDGLAVIGILFEVNNNKPVNLGMQRFATMNAQSGRLNSRLNQSFKFSWFLPELFSSFFLYDGSLTTPPCTENVDWIVLSETLAIHSETMSLLRNNGSDIIDSKPVRPLQPINGRKIEFYHTI